MAATVFPAASSASKTRYVTTLTSGTSYTVPAGVTYVNATLMGGGGGSCSYGSASAPAKKGQGGRLISSTLVTTPGASIAYAIGAGGAGGDGYGSAGGSTTFTGATTAGGGAGGSRDYGSTGDAVTCGNAASPPSATGGPGQIELEYWV